ncbi:solute carrier family 12 member 8 isoform X2 [Antennarius striatus]|uniref:solute carrier family 12 member 8 isoform X2 n=1 Tax=Antennarius striatus TaxID=241820 RepID=UPI0035B1CBCE
MKRLWKVAMESPPAGCDVPPGGDEAGLLKRGAPDVSTTSHVHDLFHEEAQGLQQSNQPWWKIKLFVWEPVLFGTWDGVFTTCMINIFGVVLFLRTGFLVGNTGVLLGMLLVSLVVTVALVTVMSGIGVNAHCGVGSGGIYSMISTVLGGRVGGTVGLLYVFGQCVAGAMYITGFSESVAEVLGLQSQWAMRSMSVTVLLALAGINLAGVKWIVRLQLLLLAILAVSTLDFVVGTFTHLDPKHGFIGYSDGLLSSNMLPDYSPGENFFTVFGVFFPAATGVMAGFNMSSDLKRPEHNIPVGTLAAVSSSCFLYLVFVFLLGGICTREALRYDYLIAEKVSLVGFLFLLGLYISSLASCMGGLYSAPRILQCITQERVIPALAFLGRGKGPNKTPVAAICLTSLLTMVFIFIGQVNVLAPIVSINFILTYSFIDYSYFSVAMALQLQNKEKSDHLKSAKVNHRRSTKQGSGSLIKTDLPNYGSGGETLQSKGTLTEFTKDMDQIFPPPSDDDAGCKKPSFMLELSNGCKGRRASVTMKEKLMDSYGFDLNSNRFTDEKTDDFCSAPPLQETEMSSERGVLNLADTPQVKCLSKIYHAEHEKSLEPRSHNTGAGIKADLQSFEIKPIQDRFYSKFCNHWVALIAALSSILIMFVIQWIYALANILATFLLYLYIGKTSPGLPTGIAARFSFFTWLRSTWYSIYRRKGSPRDEMVVTPSLSGVGLKTKQLTEENADFATRHRHHHSSFIAANEMIQPPLK